MSELDIPNIIESKNYSINGQLLLDAYQQKLIELLNQIPDTKAAVWDEYLMDSMSLISNATLFKEKNTKEFYKLSNKHVSKVDSMCIVFFVRPLLTVLDLVGEFLKHLNDIQEKKLYLYFIPNQTIGCIEKLRELGIADKFITIDILPFYIFPLDVNIFSMEQSSCFKEFYVDHDITMVMNIVNAVKVLESLYGNIKILKGIGPYSNRVINILNNNKHKRKNLDNRSTKVIDELIFIDRNVDLITPLMTQMTYEGLLDEIYGIKCGNVMIPITKQSTNTKQSTDSTIDFAINTSHSKDNELKPQKIQLFSPIPPSYNQTKIYSKMRSLNFSDVGGFLSKTTKALSKQIEENKNAKNVSEMKEFVNKLPQLNALKLQLSIHTTIAELVNKRIDRNDFRDIITTEQEFIQSFNLDRIHPIIEKKIALLDPYEDVLKLMCLQSVMCGGLKTRIFEYYCSAITHSYGYQKITTIMKLSLAGLFTVRPMLSTSTLNITNTINGIYPTAINNFNLIYNTNSPPSDSDKSQLYGCFHGYLPLSVKLINYLLNPQQQEYKNKQFQDTLKSLQGQIYLPKTASKDTHNGIQSHRNNNNVLNQGLLRTILVFFIGGCSLSEISVLEHMFTTELPGYSLMTGCTSIINSSTIFRCMEVDTIINGSE